MSLFVDQLLLQLSDPAQLSQLLAPPGDPTHTRLRTLLQAMYELPYATLHEIRDVEVRRTELQRPLFAPHRKRGTWTQTIPSHTRTDVVYESLDGLEPTWLDATAEVALTLVLEVDVGQVESILVREVADFDTLEEFRERFRYLDLDAFMAEHGIRNVEELKERYHYLLTEIRLRAPEPFDPNDPANHHHYTLNLAILIRELIDVAAALRDAKLARVALERSLTYHREVGTAQVRTPYAPLVIFSEEELDDMPFDEDELQTLFAAERILALFETPVP